MGKRELEFFCPDQLPWRPVQGSATAGAGGAGISEKILAEDRETGDVTRLLRFAPASGDASRTLPRPRRRAPVRDALPAVRAADAAALLPIRFCYGASSVADCTQL